MAQNRVLTGGHALLANQIGVEGTWHDLQESAECAHHGLFVGTEWRECVHGPDRTATAHPGRPGDSAPRRGNA
ncbi:hypothetical protein Ait01nite_007640 [Actinoplanes italicus]|nr:hypothetical protein Ait01nite_007640 [Actinoplanes italicus]